MSTGVTLRILMLEDNSTDAELIQRLLRKSHPGCVTRVASARAAFLTCLEEFKPQVILADNSLPQFDAAEAFRAVKARGINVPFILVTGTVSEEFAADIIKQGADDYILKDRMHRLPAAIEAALKQKESANDVQRTLQQLSVSEQNYRTLVERITDGFIALDKDWNYTYINKRAGEMIHRDPQTLIGRNVWEIFPDAVGSATYNAFMQAMQEQRYVNNVDYYEPLDLWQENFIYPSPEGISVFLRDISEKKRAEIESREAAETLRRSELRLKEAQSIAHISSWEIDLITQRQIWSDELYRILGVEKDESLPSREFFSSFLHPDEVDEVNEQIDKAFAALTHTRLHYRFIRRDGAVRFGYSEWKVEFNSNGEPQRMYGILQDITERKEAENELKETNRQLHDLSSYLQDVREEERIHIAREIHDELGQQLTGLKMNVHWLNKKLAPTDTQVKEKLAEIVELIDETVRSVRRISANLRPSILDDIGLIAALEWHSQEVQKRSEINVSFTASIQEPDLPVPVATGVFRIYQEVLTNAVRHANAHNITSVLDLQEDQLILNIRDDGQGMDQQAVKKKKTLGLLGIRERTFLLGGRFKLDSEPGKGTAIQITIPLNNSQ